MSLIWKSACLLLAILLFACGDKKVDKHRAMRNKITCINNLKQIGGLLKLMETGGRNIHRHSGPAFLLQVVDEVGDSDLDSFLCPGDHHPDRPDPGTEEFVRLYREMDLEKVTDWSLYTSYAGPNWKDFPRHRGSRESRLWACDACREGEPHHRGIVVLYDSTKVEFIEEADIEGGLDGSVLVGPGAPDERLATMIFDR